MVIILMNIEFFCLIRPYMHDPFLILDELDQRPILS